ncbi:MAG: hypothetical protein IJ165_05140 [Proteobacteria bacterium]|nr:hypothetical protein [Pseudomonadota bacterium]
MSKKLLAVMIALSMAGMSACSGGEEDSGNACTTNTCSGNISNICNGGKVVLTKDCGALGCNAATGVCNTTSPNPQQCDTATVSAQCAASGQMFDAASCSCKPNGGGGGQSGTVGTACDRSTYKQTCINGGANALVCWDDVVTQWDCGGGCQDAGYDPAKPLQVNCQKGSSGGGDPSNTLPNPKGDSTVAGASCDASTYYGACSDDFTKRYYCDKASGQVVEKDCASGCDPASLGNNSSKCKSGGGQSSSCTGEKVTTGGTAGTSCCDSSTYQVSCINGNANALICSKGVVAQWDCKDSQCSVADNRVTCPNPNSSGGGDSNNTLPNPNNDSTVNGATCDPSTYHGACSDDFTKRYYCDNTSNVVVEKECSSGCDPASLGGNSSKCKSGGGQSSSCTGDKVTTGGTAGTSCCDSSTYQVSCINGNANALICSGGVVKQWDCKDSQCSVADNRVTCPNPNGSGSSAECTGETVSTGGVVGQCCDAENYNPAGCNPSSNSGLRCSNGIIKEWTCKENQTCSYDSAKKWYSCN